MLRHHCCGSAPIYYGSGPLFAGELEGREDFLGMVLWRASGVCSRLGVVVRVVVVLWVVPRSEGLHASHS